MKSVEQSTGDAFGANNTLIILTKSFPFDSGEEFLESEIFTDAEAFSQVVIFATATRKHSVITRKLPENAVAYNLHESASPYVRYLKYALSGAFCACREPLKSELVCAEGMRQKIGVLYVYGRANRNCKKIMAFREVLDAIRGKVFLYSYWCSDLALTAVLLQQILSVKWDVKSVSRAHRYDLYENLNATGVIPFRRFAFSNLDAIFPCSYDGSLHLKRLYPDYADKVQTAYLGVRDYGMGPMAGKNGNFHILTCSAITPVKRVGLVAEAVAELEKRGIFVEWTCMGDGPLLNEIRKYVEQNIRHSKVNFLGRLHNPDILKFYQNAYADLFVNVSDSEGLPVSIMEAISFGIPVLATDVGGTREIVSDGVTGQLMPVTIDAKELAERIADMMERKFDRFVIRAFWKAHFCAEANYRKFADTLKSL